ncbi:MAG: hypothetical protein SYC29_07910 [Planctomycetota bacterium]|nr:hypothetical protein [Planctomycetota bacterium]
MNQPLKHINFWGGILIPVLIAAYGVYCIVTRTALLPADPYDWLRLLGRDAVVMGLGWLMAAWALHAHFFWCRLPRLWFIAEVLKWLGVAVMAAAFVYVYWGLIADLGRP